MTVSLETTQIFVFEFLIINQEKENTYLSVVDGAFDVEHLFKNTYNRSTLSPQYIHRLLAILCLGHCVLCTLQTVEFEKTHRL